MTLIHAPLQTVGTRGIVQAVLLSTCLLDIIGSPRSGWAQVQVPDPRTSNLPPVAYPGPTRTVFLGQPAALDASPSVDPDGAVVRTIWSTLGAGLKSLQISDDRGLSSTATLQINEVSEFGHGVTPFAYSTVPWHGLDHIRQAKPDIIGWADNANIQNLIKEANNLVLRTSATQNGYSSEGAVFQDTASHREIWLLGRELGNTGNPYSDVSFWNADGSWMMLIKADAYGVAVPYAPNSGQCGQLFGCLSNPSDPVCASHAALNYTSVILMSADGQVQCPLVLAPPPGMPFVGSSKPYWSDRDPHLVYFAARGQPCVYSVDLRTGTYRCVFQVPGVIRDRIKMSRPVKGDRALMIYNVDSSPSWAHLVNPISSANITSSPIDLCGLIHSATPTHDAENSFIINYEESGLVDAPMPQAKAHRTYRFFPSRPGSCETRLEDSSPEIRAGERIVAISPFRIDHPVASLDGQLLYHIGERALRSLDLAQAGSAPVTLLGASAGMAGTSATQAREHGYDAPNHVTVDLHGGIVTSISRPQEGHYSEYLVAKGPGEADFRFLAETLSAPRWRYEGIFGTTAYNSESHPALSPDGTKVYYQSDMLGADRDQFLTRNYVADPDAYVALVRKPDAPREMQVLFGSGLEVRWRKAERSLETAEFHIYRGTTSEPYRRIGRLPQGQANYYSFTDRDLLSSLGREGTARYFVVAIEHSGLESEPSVVVEYTYGQPQGSALIFRDRLPEAMLAADREIPVAVEKCFQTATMAPSAAIQQTQMALAEIRWTAPANATIHRYDIFTNQGQLAGSVRTGIHPHSSYLFVDRGATAVNGDCQSNYRIVAHARWYRAN